MAEGQESMIQFTFHLSGQEAFFVGLLSRDPTLIRNTVEGVETEFLLGCHMAIRSENEFNLVVFFFSVSGKVFPVTPLLSGVSVRRVFCAYFGKFQGVVEMRRFLCCYTVEYLINLQWRRSH